MKTNENCICCYSFIHTWIAEVKVYKCISRCPSMQPYWPIPTGLEFNQSFPLEWNQCWVHIFRTFQFLQAQWIVHGTGSYWSWMMSISSPKLTLNLTISTSQTTYLIWIPLIYTNINWSQKNLCLIQLFLQKLKAFFQELLLMRIEMKKSQKISFTPAFMSEEQTTKHGWTHTWTVLQHQDNFTSQQWIRCDRSITHRCQFYQPIGAKAQSMTKRKSAISTTFALKNTTRLRVQPSHKDPYTDTISLDADAIKSGKNDFYFGANNVGKIDHRVPKSYLFWLQMMKTGQRACSAMNLMCSLQLLKIQSLPRINQ